jgi:DNA-binding sugar fermentation-stimulating protein
MFPDAVTARGKRPIEELAHLSGKGIAEAVLFLIFSPRARGHRLGLFSFSGLSGIP